MATPPTRTLDSMIAELVHHMARMVEIQKDTNHLLNEILRTLSRTPR